MTYSLLCLCLGALLAVSALPAQVVTTAKGPVEFIGLKRWTIPMIEDSLRVYDPKGHGLWGCAAELTTKLHFAAASVIRREWRDSIYYSVITVIVPQDSARVQWKPMQRGDTSLVADYRTADSLFRVDDWSFQHALLSYRQFARGATDSAFAKLRAADADTVAASALWVFLSRRTSPGDLEHAAWTMLHSADYRSRVVAGTVLANFPQHDLAWWTLMDALRDPHPFVASAARQTMLTLVTERQWRVDWRPAAEGLRLLLRGTNLFAYVDVLNALSRTDVERGLAPVLLDRASSELVLANLEAKNPDEHRAALAFLRTMSGRDYGEDVAAWRRWTETLGVTRDAPDVLR